MATKKIEFSTPSSMGARMKEYFDSCGDTKFPSLVGMFLFMGITEQEYQRYLRTGENVEAFRRLDTMAMYKRQEWLIQATIRDSKNSSAYIHLLKQPENGGLGNEGQKNGQKTVLHEFAEGMTPELFATFNS